jgi:hypothetical protein
MKKEFAGRWLLTGQSLLLILTGILFEGCGTTGGTEPTRLTCLHLPREQLAAIREIGIADLTLPKQAMVIDVRSARAGAIAAAVLGPGVLSPVAAGIGSVKSDEYTKKWTDMFENGVGENPSEVAQQFKGELQKQLQEIGHPVSQNNTANAYLDINIRNFGYVNIEKSTLQDGKGNSFKPFFLATINLRSREGHAVYFSKEYFNLEETGSLTLLGASTEDTFKDVEEMIADPNRAKAGIRHAAAIVARKVATSLVPQGAGLYIYRADTSPYPLMLEVDGNLASTIEGSECVYLTVGAGQHSIHIYLQPATKMAAADKLETFTTIDAADGGTYYVKISMGSKSALLPLPSIQANLLTEAEGQRLVGRLLPH